MGPEAQRIAIAEACGWTDCRPVASKMDDKPWISGYNPKPYSSVSAYIFQGEPIVPPIQQRESLPNYLSDLNAMHEAENTLDENQWRSYGDLLVAKIRPHAGPGLWNHRHIHATAAQRAEAFLRTIGKWDDTK